MKILIKASDADVAQRIKELLESFGKGMRIFTKDDGFSYYGCVLLVGDAKVWNEPELVCHLDNPTRETDWEQLQKQLWAFYRDNIKDTFGTKCSCGLYDICRCH